MAKIAIHRKIVIGAARIIRLLCGKEQPSGQREMVERFNKEIQARRANQAHLKAKDNAPDSTVTRLNMHKRFIKKMQERRVGKWGSWRAAYEAEKTTTDWPVWSPSYAKKLEADTKTYEQSVRDAEYAALLERQARERAELAAELERTRPARARALAEAELAARNKSFLYSLPPLPHDCAH